MAPKKRTSGTVTAPAPRGSESIAQTKSDKKKAAKLKAKRGAKAVFPIDIVQDVRVSDSHGKSVPVAVKDLTFAHKQVTFTLPKKSDIIGCHISVRTSCAKNGCRHEYYHSRHALPKVYYGRHSLYKPLCFVRASQGNSLSTLQYVKIRPRDTGQMAPTEKEKRHLSQDNPHCIESFSQDVVIMVKASGQSWWQKLFARKKKNAKGRS